MSPAGSQSGLNRRVASADFCIYIILAEAK